MGVGQWLGIGARGAGRGDPAVHGRGWTRGSRLPPAGPQRPAQTQGGEVPVLPTGVYQSVPRRKDPSLSQGRRAVSPDVGELGCVAK